MICLLNHITEYDRMDCQQQTTKTYQILALKVRHLFNDAPEPALEFNQLFAAFARFVIECGVGD